MNSSQLEFSSLNTFLHPGSFYLTVNSPWLLLFYIFTVSAQFFCFFFKLKSSISHCLKSIHKWKMEIAVMFGLVIHPPHYYWSRIQQRSLGVWFFESILKLKLKLHNYFFLQKQTYQLCESLHSPVRRNGGGTLYICPFSWWTHI